MLYKKIVHQDIQEVISALKSKSSDFDFVVRDVFDMAENFKDHGVVVDDDFEYYSIMLCNPQKAYQSIKGKMIRGAVLLPPKQVVVYSEELGQTVIAYEAPNKERIANIMPDDVEFQDGLVASGQKIIELIKSLGV